MNKYIFILSVFVLFSCTSKNTDNTEYLFEDIDNLTLEEAIEQIKKQNEDFQKIVAFYDSPGFFDESEAAVYTKDEEKYSELPEFMQAVDIERGYREYFAAVYLSQENKYPETELKIENDEHGIEIPAKPEFYTKAIYYHNGSVDTTRRALGHWTDFPTAKVIDSIHTVASYSYAGEYDQFEVKNKLEIEGGAIKISKIKGNTVELYLSGTARDYEKIVALNDEGKVLSFSSSTSTTEGAGKVYKKYAKAFDALAKKADKFKSKEELKKEITKTLSKLPSVDDDSRPTIYNAMYKGNVHSIIIYIPKEKFSRKVSVTLVNKNACKSDLVYTFDTENKKYGFTNQDGEFVIEPTYANLEQSNYLYYYLEKESKDDESVYETYFLDIPAKTLRLISGIDIAGVPTFDCIIAEKDEKYAVWGAEGKPVTGYIYDMVEEIPGNDKLMAVAINRKYGIIDEMGNTILPAEYSYIGDFLDNRAIIDKNHKPFAFIDEQGKQVISLTQYESVREFSDGLAAVKKNDLWGFINTTGKLVIPFKYNKVDPFSYGVTMAVIDGLAGLIDTKGNEIAPIESSSYWVNENFGKRAYNFGGKKYNHLGQAE